MLKDIKLHRSWNKFLQKEFEKDYMRKLDSFLDKEQKKGKVIFPDTKNYFTALNLTPYSKVKVVILGQDPYHGEKQAHGLSFSVNEGIKVPPSLKNIFKEIKEDLNIDFDDCGDLRPWAKEGVLLLNSVLTVEASKAGSHRKKGWEQFTDTVIQSISDNKDSVVFVLWGSYAHSKEALIDSSKHLILKSVHPSPLSAYRGFFGCKHFSTINEYLLDNGKSAINWSLV